jgi:hypothetical protein
MLPLLQESEVRGLAAQSVLPPSKVRTITSQRAAGCLRVRMPASQSVPAVPRLRVAASQRAVRCPTLRGVTSQSGVAVPSFRHASSQRVTTFPTLPGASSQSAVMCRTFRGAACPRAVRLPTSRGAASQRVAGIPRRVNHARTADFELIDLERDFLNRLKLGACPAAGRSGEWSATHTRSGGELDPFNGGWSATHTRSCRESDPRNGGWSATHTRSNPSPSITPPFQYSTIPVPHPSTAPHAS